MLLKDNLCNNSLGLTVGPLKSDPLQKRILVFGHHKCATSWLRKIFIYTANSFQFNYQVINGGNNPLDFGKNKPEIYLFVNSTIKLARLAMDASNKEVRCVHIIRDPRDALISQYWSWKVSHPLSFQSLVKTRPILESLSFEQGMTYLLENELLMCGEQLKDWYPDSCDKIITIKYEDMVKESFITINTMLKNCFGHLAVGIDTLSKQIAETTAFDVVTGRSRGCEKQQDHLRSGSPGEWSNKFTNKITDIFKDKYGDIVVNWGYEKDNDW